ncbi:MAG: hypothetical protein O7G87_07245, partial [bacterium]|nr:hypothetical protein [bacterium]
IPTRETAERDLLLGQVLLSLQETLQDSTTVIAVAPDLRVLADGLETQPLQTAVTIVRIAPPLTGDFDNNGSVDFQDFLLFASAFGKTDSKFDLDGDGAVAFPDFLIFATAFGQTTERKE